MINRAWKILENEKTRKRCLEIVEEAKGMTDQAVCFSLENPQKLCRVAYLNLIFFSLPRRENDLKKKERTQKLRKMTHLSNS